MRPINSLMKFGSANEPNIIAALPDYLDGNVTGYLLDSVIASRGLLQNIETENDDDFCFFGTSIDGCVMVKVAEGSPERLACVK